MPDVIKFDRPEQFPLDEVVNDKDRIARGWMSVEVKDKQGEIIPISEFEKTMNTLMKRGGFLTDQHTNRVVGKILNWKTQKHEKSGKDGIIIDYQIYDDYSVDNMVWDEIKSGKRTGLSFGGRALDDPSYVKDASGVPAKKLAGIEAYEVASVMNPANQLALNEAVNFMAKSEDPEYEKERAEHPTLSDAAIRQIVSDHKKGVKTGDKKIDDVVEAINDAGYECTSRYGTLGKQSPAAISKMKYYAHPKTRKQYSENEVEFKRIHGHDDQLYVKFPEDSMWYPVEHLDIVSKAYETNTCPIDNKKFPDGMALERHFLEDHKDKDFDTVSVQEMKKDIEKKTVSFAIAELFTEAEWEKWINNPNASDDEVLRRARKIDPAIKRVVNLDNHKYAWGAFDFEKALTNTTGKEEKTILTSDANKDNMNSNADKSKSEVQKSNLMDIWNKIETESQGDVTDQKMRTIFIDRAKKAGYSSEEIEEFLDDYTKSINTSSKQMAEQTAKSEITEKGNTMETKKEVPPAVMPEENKPTNDEKLDKIITLLEKMVGSTKANEDDECDTEEEKTKAEGEKVTLPKPQAGTPETAKPENDGEKVMEKSVEKMVNKKVEDILKSKGITTTTTPRPATDIVKNAAPVQKDTAYDIIKQSKTGMVDIAKINRGIKNSQLQAEEDRLRAFLGH